MKLLDAVCEQCQQPMKAQRTTKRFCSNECYRAMRVGYPRERECKRCGTPFKVLHKADANRRYCNQKCSKAAERKLIGDWQKQNPELMREYTAKWRAENPDYYRERNVAKRAATLALLGGACVVCGVTNPFWLHIDYIPTCRGLRYRHPRGLAYVRNHVEDFRLLCANHHYELTLTGRIEGTDITQ